MHVCMYVYAERVVEDPHLMYVCICMYVHMFVCIGQRVFSERVVEVPQLICVCVYACTYVCMYVCFLSVHIN
jgi:hypothetical protein